MPKRPAQPGRTAIKRLIAALADQEPPFSSLGTPFLVDTEVTDALVRRGKAAVPALTDALEHGEPKIAMYAAYCLGQIGDPATLPALAAARDKYLAREPKAEYDFGVVSAASRAIEQLQEPST
jgi:HEAT repeat protein